MIPDFDKLVGDKYSPSLQKAVTQWSKLQQISVFRHADYPTNCGPDQHLIGYLFDRDVIGRSLLSIITGRGSPQFSFPGSKWVEDPTAWVRYAAIGYCAFDPQHDLWLPERWNAVNDTMRTCKFCGQVQVRDAEPVQIVNYSKWKKQQ